MPGKIPKLKVSNPKEYNAIIGGQNNPNSWRIGVVTVVDESRLPLGAVVQAKNMMQTQDGVWSTRWGSKNYGATYAGPVTGFAAFTTFTAGVQTQYYMIIDNGTLKYAHDGGAWNIISGYTFNTTVWSTMIQYENKLLICNGIDVFSYVDLTTFVWHGFTGLSAPGTVTASLGSSLSASNPVTTLYYQVTAVTATGETQGSPVCTQAVNVDRNNWYNPNATQVASNNYYINLSWSAVSNAIGYNIYLSDGVSGVSYYLDSTNTNAYTDYGAAAINDFIQVPLTNTTTAPAFSWIALSDNRLWAIGDPANPSRLYWAGTGPQYALGFNPFVGGGWVDILPGSPVVPTFVGQFRNGQGSPMTTILTSAVTGYGDVWNCQITSSTIGNTVIAIPTLVKNMETFGTTAPRSVVQTQQNVYYHSPGPAGFYSNGSVATLFNVLSTNEVSILIRPDIKAITLTAAPGITGLEFDRKIFYSVPYGSTQNNRIMIYDLNKQNWNPYAFNFGISQFIRYVDNSGNLHLLGIPTAPTAGNYIIEINQNFVSGDNGVAFDSHLQTGLIHVTPDHVQFAFIRYIYYEFGSPQGNLSVLFSGTVKNENLAQIASYPVTLGDPSSNVGLDTFPLSSKPLSYATAAPIATTQLSVKERVRISKLLNNWEAEVYSNNLNSQWTLNQVIVKGILIPTADPSSWIIN